MERVRIPAAAGRLSDYPFQFSGGMRQRALIAMALSLQPDLLIADEPTTALDVTTQAQILDLLAALQADSGMGMILITHNIGVAAKVARRVLVMYAGRVAEIGPTERVLRRPSHPYTKGLRDSLPSFDMRQDRLTQIPGAPPDLSNVPPGCSFHPRCSWAKPGLCDQVRPELRTVAGAQVACHFAEEVMGTSSREHGSSPARQ
jgi:oligopeptide/dipeptide ABC transporter ATP-binding protein